MPQRNLQSTIAQLRRLNLDWIADQIEEARRKDRASSLDAFQAKVTKATERSSRVLRDEGDRSSVDRQEQGTEMRYDPMAGTGAKKFDEGKPRYDLIPPLAVEAAAQVFGFGAAKYGDRNWEQGLDFGRLKGALHRHVEAWWMGEEDDPESGLPHLGHAMCCLMMLTEEALNGNYELDVIDDRPATDRRTRTDVIVGSRTASPSVDSNDL